MTDDKAHAIVPAERMDPYALLSKAIEVGAGIETVERLVALAQEVRALQAREAWYGAMAQFQKDCPKIHKTLTARIQTSRASFNYSYAPLSEILDVIQPVMAPLGLSVSWRLPRIVDDRVITSCRVAHAMGHVEDSGEIAVPIITKDPEIGASPPQRVGAAMTYARRYSLMAIVGLAPEEDDDAQNPVSQPSSSSTPSPTTTPTTTPTPPTADDEPSFAPWGAIQMVTQLAGGKFSAAHLELYFPGCRTKGQLEAMERATPDAYRESYRRLRADYKAGRAGPASG
jgi:ERF superfamily